MKQNQSEILAKVFQSLTCDFLYNGIVYLYFRGRVHYECPKDIDDIVKAIPDLILLN